MDPFTAAIMKYQRPRIRLAQKILKRINIEERFTTRTCVLAGYDEAKKEGEKAGMNIIQACKAATTGKLLYSRSRRLYMRAGPQSDPWPQFGKFWRPKKKEFKPYIDYSEAPKFADLLATDWKVIKERLADEPKKED